MGFELLLRRWGKMKKTGQMKYSKEEINSQKAQVSCGGEGRRATNLKNSS